MKINRKTRAAQEPGRLQRDRAHQHWRRKEYLKFSGFKPGRQARRAYRFLVADKKYFHLPMMTYPLIYGK